MELADIINLMKTSSKKEIKLVTKAFNFAQLAHQGQKRFSGEPYFEHPFCTAKILANFEMSSVVVSVGLLHDILKDGVVKESKIKEEFGEELLFLVRGVTKLGKLKYQGVQRYNESLRKLFVAVSQDIRIIIIKLADRLHNMQTLKYVQEHKRKRIAMETLEIYVPIAYRLSIRRFNRELEDLAFPFVYPKEYEKTKNLLKTKTKQDFNKLNKFQRSIKKALAKKGIVNFSVDYRIKSLYSSYKKLKKKDWDIEDIYDMSALRVIVPNIEECYKIFGIIHRIWRYLPGKIKDYISFPKPNGYQALHTTIFTGYGNVIEIQIKTKEMHRGAEYGMASHLLYKKNIEREKSKNYSQIKDLLSFKTFNTQKKEILNNIPKWIKDFAEYQKTEKNKENIGKDMKSDFFQQRIFVFTPNGDVIDLPINSTPIDFAYVIHTDIGNHVAGAKINGKLTSLETSLINGDIIKILTKKDSYPSRKWLEVVKTAIARSYIKKALKKIDKSNE